MELLELAEAAVGSEESHLEEYVDATGLAEQCAQRVRRCVCHGSLASCVAPFGELSHEPHFGPQELSLPAACGSGRGAHEAQALRGPRRSAKLQQSSKKLKKAHGLRRGELLRRAPGAGGR